MAKQSLNKSLKSQATLTTDVGDFTYVKCLGEGGNSFVFHFTKGSTDFAIKFLKSDSSRKVSRFKDEFFCSMQIPSHKNISQSYHFDSVTVSGVKYLIIIMKYYQSVLSNKANLSSETEEAKSNKAWKLFRCLANAIHHLHTHNIIHRDIKPANIFYDKDYDEFVLGDLGIANFCNENFPRESKTESSERMANFKFSAPEQADSTSRITPSSDIYSLGQLIHHYITGKTVRGLNREQFSNSDSEEKLIWLDKIVEICLHNDADKRFQNVEELVSFLEELKKPSQRNYWRPIRDLDETIRKSFPRIDGTLLTKDKSLIHRFFNNFRDLCDSEDFCFMDLNGGNNLCGTISPIENDRWLFRQTEIDIDSITIYHNGVLGTFRPNVTLIAVSLD